MPTSDERMIAMLMYIVSFFVPVLGPLIIWLIKRDDSDFIDFHGKEYFNFFISFTIYSIISTILMLVLVGFILIIVIAILMFIFTLIALIKAYNGERYRIPLTIRLLK
ncbi:DUF4870 domain-containing protein [Virgibacillus sp. W0430]|uniref:DUF4870 domain-containing protein n=1 Tax=Virgibacillus sp. W0430 TaxID=3391580 RepID=UPI003F48A74A